MAGRAPTVQLTPAKWNPDYLNGVQAGVDHDIHLLGWTGDYGDAYNFLGTFFGAQDPQFGFDNPAIFEAAAVR